MRTLYKVFLLTLVKQFYEDNVGFFLFVIAFAFGFMSGAEHKALAALIVNSKETLLIPAVIWGFYLFKIISFNHQQLAENQNHFLFNLGLLEKKIVSLVMLFTTTLQFLPAILYAVFLIHTAISNNQFIISIYIIFLLLMFIVIGLYDLYKNLQYPIRSKKVSKFENVFNQLFKRGQVQIYLEWLMRKEWLTVTGVKILSCALLTGTMYLYKVDAYDLRLAGLGTMIAFSLNLSILRQFQIFENDHFLNIRNLPIALGKRFMMVAWMLFIICIPEILILFRSYPESLPSLSLITTISFGLSTGLLFYGIIYTIQEEEKLTQSLFAMIIAWFVLILFKFPLSMLALFNTVIGLTLHCRNYYSFEKLIKP